MALYAVEVVVHGRRSVVVEASSEVEAEVKACDHPDIMEFDKLYEIGSTVVGRV